MGKLIAVIEFMMIFLVSCNMDSSSDISSSYNPDINVYYNSPLVNNKPHSESDSEIGKILINLIDNSTESIDFALYGLRDQPMILEALSKASDRGVVIRGIVDKNIYNENYYSNTEDLINTIDNISTDYISDVNNTDKNSNYSSVPFWPVPAGFLGPPQMVGYSLEDNMAIIAVHASKEKIEYEGNIMHNKFFVFDSETLWTGSTNASNTGTGGYNANIACVIKNEKIAGFYIDEFNQMYEMNRFHNDKQQIDSNKIVFFDDGTQIEVLFSPQDSVIPKGIRPLIKGAKESIDIPVFYLTDKYITGDLIKAHQRGVAIRIIIDATSAQNGYTKHEILRAAGIAVKVENWGGKMHMKSIIVDHEYVVVGSMNFTTAGTRNNDENTLIIHNTFYANEATKNFDNLWESIPDEFLTKNVSPESNESVNSMTDGIDNDFDMLIDSEDDGTAISAQLPPYYIVPKEDGYNLIKGIENKNGFMIYILPNNKYYHMYLVNKSNEFYFPSIEEAKEAGFVKFNYQKHILLK